MSLAGTVKTVRQFGGQWCDDGYEFMGAGVRIGWTPMSGWGLDGWDLGDWPYVVVLFRDYVVAPSGVTLYQRAIYVEGDITIETFRTAESRQEATDETALFYWKAQGADWLDRGDDLKGPFSWARLEAAKPATKQIADGFEAA